MDFVWLTFYSQVNTIKVMSNTVRYLHTLFSGILRPPKQFTSTKSTYFLSPVNDKCLTWFSGRERMAVETISWPIYTKVIWLDMGSISQPLDWRQMADLPHCQLCYRARWICVHVCKYVYVRATEILKSKSVRSTDDVIDVIRTCVRQSQIVTKTNDSSFSSKGVSKNDYFSNTL